MNENWNRERVKRKLKWKKKSWDCQKKLLQVGKWWIKIPKWKDKSTNCWNIFLRYYEILILWCEHFQQENNIIYITQNSPIYGVVVYMSSLISCYTVVNQCLLLLYVTIISDVSGWWINLCFEHFFLRFQYF